MSAAMSTAVAVVFSWVGLVVGISFIEAPLKFRAPDVTVRIGLGIGRLVFRVVNSVEAVLAVVLTLLLVLDTPSTTGVVAPALAVALLAVQLLGVRPSLARRSNAVLAGEDAPRSHAHVAYVVLEVVKLVALLVGGVSVLTTG